ncbi:tetraprenyl-beta-curcumene synthase family protein [Paenibacillus sediminis]|uniref:Tetraprenyl-beta-curcumene synthase n=1 Tax=Paenibacillus sediminis TaxID=664909 RepID=A0ABS4H5E5_9BACL|nr:tetraprenyl-beta-curcumene synthase family protein [Paenibacillus sediminis]MBP1937754.1 tetraprenyl-beta-curcumene synthase [Paenibacillus sediminis]
MNYKEDRRYQAPRSAVVLMNRVYKYILPEVRTELDKWRETAKLIPDPELRKQALASIATKQFHCEGGAVYAAVNLPGRHILIPLIVAYQTISDYLDNLCDRSTSMDGDDFRLLHQSMLDAVDPSAELVNYYALHQEQNDGGYLHALVTTCQTYIRQLPSYPSVLPYIQDLVKLYTDLQVYKHIRPELREPALLKWWTIHKHRTPHLQWNEFAAATGSTLGVFMLFLAASQPRLHDDEASQIYAAYFPHICSLHIMLDYLIDQDEDRIGGDLNFCNYYDNSQMMLDRIAKIVEWARKDATTIPASSFHRMIIEGLLALYLSDPKVSEQQEVRAVSKRLMKKSPMTRLFFFVNSRWIRKHMYEK